MPRIRECDYCGADIEPGTGTMFVQTSGTTIHFCSSKCENNADLGRDARNLEWTEAGRTTTAAQDAEAEAAAEEAAESEDEESDETAADAEDDEAEAVDDEDEADADADEDAADDGVEEDTDSEADEDETGEAEA